MNYYDQIEDYVLGRLDAKATVEFEDAMKQDSALQEEVAQMRLIKSGFEQHQRKEIKNRIKNGLKRPPKRSNPRWIFIGLSLLFFALAFLAYQKWVAPKPTPQEFYAQYYDPTPRFDIERSVIVNDSVVSLLNQYYISEDYPKIEEEVIKIPDSLMTNDLRFIYALAQIGNEKTEEALSTLTTISNTDDPMYNDQVRWITALLHLESNELALAKPILEAISADSLSKHQDSAQNILSQLVWD